MTRDGLLGFAVIVFCVAGLTFGIARLAPESNGGDIIAAVVAAILGALGFAVVLRLGRRGASPPWAKWLIVPILLSAIYLDHLSERWQLALLALAAGYVAAFLGTIIVRAIRLTR